MKLVIKDLYTKEIILKTDINSKDITVLPLCKYIQINGRWFDNDGLSTSYIEEVYGPIHSTESQLVLFCKEQEDLSNER